MKKIIVILFGLIALIAHAQVFKTEKPIVCSDLKTVFETVITDYQEEPVWRGDDEVSKFVMTANKKTGTWTIIQYNDKLACVVGTGTGHKLILNGLKI